MTLHITYLQQKNSTEKKRNVVIKRASTYRVVISSVLVLIPSHQNTRMYLFFFYFSLFSFGLEKDMIFNDLVVDISED